MVGNLEGNGVALIGLREGDLVGLGVCGRREGRLVDGRIEGLVDGLELIDGLEVVEGYEVIEGCALVDGCRYERKWDEIVLPLQEDIKDTIRLTKLVGFEVGENPMHWL